MKYFMVEVTTMKDGSTIQAIWEKPSEAEAYSSMCQMMASATINTNVQIAYAEVRNNMGAKLHELFWEVTSTVAE